MTDITPKARAEAGPRARAEAEPGAEPAAPDALSFRQAMDELEGILERVEGEEIDIDQLAAELARAAKLLELCRGKIRKAEVEVTQIVQNLETPTGEKEPAGG